MMDSQDRIGLPFKASDGTVDSNTAPVVITVNAVNEPPVAERQDVTANSGEPTPITLEATDPQGNDLTYALVSNPRSGTITDFNEDTGSLVYTSNDGFTGQDRFTFKASDGTVDSNTAPVVITVNAVNEPPVAERQDVTANSGEPTPITLEATDPQGNDLTYALVSNPRSGTITDFNEDTGSLVYTSNDGFTGQDRFTFKASDGTVDSNTAPVVITVNAVEPTPEPEPEPDNGSDSPTEDDTTSRPETNHARDDTTSPETTEDDTTSPETTDSTTSPTPTPTPTPTPPSSSSNSTNSSPGGLFSDGFPGFADNMRNFFGGN